GNMSGGSVPSGGQASTSTGGGTSTGEIPTGIGGASDTGGGGQTSMGGSIAGGAGASSAGGGNHGGLPRSDCRSHLLPDATAACPARSVILPPAALILGHSSRRYEGPLPKCNEFSPTGNGFRFRFRVDDITEGDNDVFDAAYLNGANVDVEPPCGHSLRLAG